MDAYELVAGGSGVLAALASWAMGAFVYASAPSRTQNRLVALFLGLVGFQVGTTFGYLRYLTWETAGAGAVAIASAITQSFVYLALLGTLDSPLSRPFRSRAGRSAALVAAALSILLWPLYHRAIVTPDGGSGPAYYHALFAHGLVLLYGFLVALSAWRRAPRGSATRARGRAFTLAFGLRDVVFFVFITAVSLQALVLVPSGSGIDTRWFLLQNLAVPLSVIAMVLLMGYGMAKAQLFEVDAKLKLSVRRGAVAGAFLAVFFVASQLVEAFSGETFGLVGGALASGLLLFALAPLQRAAERVSSVVVPDARPLAARPEDEREELYREQVRIAWEDGRMGLKERRMLDAARERLGLAPERAVALEAEVVNALPA